MVTLSSSCFVGDNDSIIRQVVICHRLVWKSYRKIATW